MSTPNPVPAGAIETPLPEEEGLTVEIDLNEQSPLSHADDLEPAAAAPAAPAAAAPVPPLDPAVPPQAVVPEPAAPPTPAPESPEMAVMRQRLQALETEAQRRNEADTKAEQLLGVKELEGKIVDVKTKLKAAYENGDTSAQVELNDQLSDLKADLKISSLVAKKAGQAATKAPEPLPLADDWRGKNKWFGQSGFEDETDAVRVIDARVAQAGYDPRTPAYYAELNRRVAKALPHLVKAGPQPPAPPATPPPTPPAAPVRTAAPAAPGAKRTVTLTKADQLQMERIGLNPNDPLHCKRYAQELVRAQVAEGAQS